MHDVDDEAVDRFWRFVHERHMVWHRMIVEQEDPPWTDDEILSRYYFTNVYRELDPGTQYAIQDLLDRDASRPDTLFNLLIYRLIGRKETHEHLGFQSAAAFEPDAFETALKQRRNEGPVFTGAYMVSGYGSGDKIESIARIFADISDDTEEVVQDLLAADRLQDAYTRIKKLPGFGTFLAYQVLIDLLYPLASYTLNPFLPFSPNDWAVPGPGAKRGLALLAPDAAASDHLAIMQHLQQTQDDALTQRGLDFQYIKDHTGERLPLSVANIQNCCCEYHKYEKIQDNPRRARRTFTTAPNVTQLRRRYQAAPNITL